MNFYEILKTKKLGRGSPDYWAQLFAEHVGGKGEWKVAGTLPLTFTAKGGTVADWVIYGNDDVGKNLFDYSQGCNWASGSNGTSNQKITAQQGDVFTVTSTSALYALVRGYDANDAIISGSAWSTGGTSTYTAPANISYVKVIFRNFEYTAITAEQKATINEAMLVKGSTAPDHYIPYQKGVGERTGNLFDKDARDTENGYIEASYLRLDNNVFSNNSFMVSEYIPVEPNSDYYLSKVVTYGTSTGLCFYDENKTYISGVRLYAGGELTTNITTPNNCRYIRTSIQVSQSVWKESMITQGSTPPETYIPYGYQIPIAVSQQGQTDKNYDVYIGDSPLTEGETVSKSSTGVDIELFEGENTVSTTLYNKPTMEIKYK